MTRSILREVGKLSEQWNNLIDRSDHWKHSLDEYMTVSTETNFIQLMEYQFIIWIITRIHIHDESNRGGIPGGAGGLF